MFLRRPPLSLIIRHNDSRHAGDHFDKIDIREFDGMHSCDHISPAFDCRAGRTACRNNYGNPLEVSCPAITRISHG
jgi:hypothetical protein